MRVTPISVVDTPMVGNCYAHSKLDVESPVIFHLFDGPQETEGQLPPNINAASHLPTNQ